MTALRPTKAAASIKAGDAHPALEKTFTTVDLVAYGAATWDWHRLHYDADYARSLKLPGVIVDGQAFGGFFAKAVLDWLGPKAFLSKMTLRMKSMVFAGDTIRIEGEVTGVRVEGAKAVVSLSQRMKCGEKIAAETAIEVSLPG